MNFQSPVSLSVPAPPSVSEEWAADQQGFSIADLLQVLKSRRQVIIGTAIAVVALTAVVVYLLTPIYSATAMVMIDSRRNNVVDVESVMTGLATDPTSIENQVQILRSRRLAGRVIDKLHLQQDAEFDPGSAEGQKTAFSMTNPLTWIDMSRVATFMNALNPKSWFGAPPASSEDPDAETRERDALINRFLSRVEVLPQGRSTVIGITFTSISAPKSARIVNALATEYVQDQLNAKFEATEQASSWLAERLQNLNSQVQAAEAAVQQYKVENNISETSAGQSIVSQQMADLNGQLILARSQLAEQEAKYSRVRELQRSGRAADVSQVVASPLIAQLRQQETELLRKEAEFTSRYGQRHPKMQDLVSEKRNLEAKILEEVRRVVETVASDAAIARARVNSLSQSLRGIQTESAGEGKARIKLRELEAAAASSRSLYEAFLSRFKETEGQDEIQTPDARIISQAPVPGSPSFPKKTQILTLSIPAGLLLGLLLAFAVERFDSGFRRTSQVEAALGIPVLATIPEAGSSGRSASDQILEKPLSAYSESIRGLHMGLMLSNVDHKPKVVLVTSALPGEGKTTVSVSLARLAAANGQRVAVIDGDLRRPAVAKTFNVSTGKRDIIEALSGNAPLDKCLYQDKKSSVVFMSTTRQIKNPTDILQSAAMRDLITKLRHSCDLVVIDSAPLLPVHDTKILSQFADAVVFVARWEKTPRQAAIDAVRILNDVQANVAGVALTRADTGRFQYYNYGYNSYHSYNQYYTG